MRPGPSLLALALLLWPTSAWALPTQERQAELRYLVRQDCGSCHGLTLKGGLGAPLLPERLRDRRPEDLTRVILQGLPGTPMPPWSPYLSADEARWIAEALQEGI